MKQGRPANPVKLAQIEAIFTNEVKLTSVQFVKEAFVNFVLISSFKGDITLHDSYVSFIVDDQKYMVPLSNITSASFKKY